MDILINQETHKSNLIYLFSIRSFPLWEILKNKEIYAINLVDSVSLNIKSKCKNLGGIKKLFLGIRILCY